MKDGKWLAISWALNIVSWGALLVLAAAWPGRAPLRDFAGAAASQAVKQPVESPPVVERTATARRQIRTLSETDWPSLVKALRNAGIPESVLAATVASDFELRWHKRQRALESQFARGEVDTDALAEFNAQYSSRREQELRSLLGQGSFRAWDQERLFRERNFSLASLAPQEREAAYQLEKDWEQQAGELREARRLGTLDDADFETAFTAKRVELDQQLKSLLGEARFAEVTLAEDPGNSQWRRSLLGLEVSDDQLKALAAAQEQWKNSRAKLQAQEELGHLEDYEQQRQTLDALRDLQFQQVLGADGFAQYQKAQDNTYQTLKRCAAVWQLSQEDLTYLYNAVRSFQKQRNDYQSQAQALERQGQLVDWEKVQQMVRESGLQTEQALRSYLGEERFDRLKRNQVLATLGS